MKKVCSGHQTRHHQPSLINIFRRLFYFESLERKRVFSFSRAWRTQTPLLLVTASTTALCRVSHQQRKRQYMLQCGNKQDTESENSSTRNIPECFSFGWEVRKGAHPVFGLITVTLAVCCFGDFGFNSSVKDIFLIRAVFFYFLLKKKDMLRTSDTAESVHVFLQPGCWHFSRPTKAFS